MPIALVISALALVLPAFTYSQQEQYRLIDLGTLGGSNSGVNGTPPPMINNRGVVAGIADTLEPCSYLGGVKAPAFKWDNGTMTNLGLLPGGCFSLPNSINSKGMIVGSGDVGVLDPITSFPVLHADLRYKGQILDLGTLGGPITLANQVNERGQVVGFAENTDPDPWNFGQIVELPSPYAWRGFIWEKGVMHELPTLGGPDSMATVINNRGQVAGFSLINSIPNATTGIPTVDPFLWHSGEMIDLGTLGGTFGVAGAINNSGQVSGVSDLAGDLVHHAFVWDEWVLTDLGTLGGENSDNSWINDAGQVVGRADLPDCTHHATVWQNGVITDLGTIGGDPCSNGIHINARGQAVGTSTDCQGTILHIFLWENGSLIDLSAQVLPGSGFAVVDPVSINDAGEIVGQGILPNGDVHAVVLRPNGPCNKACSAVLSVSPDRAAIAHQLSRDTKTASLELPTTMPLARIGAGALGRYWFNNFRFRSLLRRRR
jgi:probable HAF family extracellular repeat protein